MVSVETSFYQSVIERHIGSNAEVLNVRTVPGGCINNAQRISTIKGDFFIKWNKDAKVDFFAKEALSLDYLRGKNIISVPGILGYGEEKGIPYLLLEYIHSGKRDKNFWQDFGIKLAGLHRITHDSFGFEFDNYIGSLPQSNIQFTNWIDFFIEKRLKVQLQYAKYNKLISKELEQKFDLLFTKLPDLLITESPSLIHGDLWNGNVMTDQKGFVCLMDPAVYFANREIELAFTQLFGGFDPSFYAAYSEAFPLEKGYEKRFDIYNLYPLLVHVNLFGVEYLKSVESILKKNR